MADTIKARGEFTVTVRDAKTGVVTQQVHVKNKIVNTGLAAMLQLLYQPASVTLTDKGLKYLEVGQGTTPPAAGDTGLDTPFSTPKKIQIVPSNFSLAGTVLTITAAWSETDSSIDNQALTEAGLRLADNTLFARQIHATVTKFAGQTLEYRWVIQFEVT